MNLVLVMATTLAVLAVVLFALSRRVQVRIGIPAGEIFYQDLNGQPFQAEVLRSSLWGISGKPDCLIRTSEGVVPVEFKRSKKAPARGGIYPNHSIQNLAYCALVEDQMHLRAGLPSVRRNHRLAGRCSGCGLRASCSERLV